MTLKERKNGRRLALSVNLLAVPAWWRAIKRKVKDLRKKEREKT